jgi:hypothetical protein
MRTNLSTLITIEQEVWSGDTLRFQMRGLGQTAAGTIDVLDDMPAHRGDVALAARQPGGTPAPAVRREATLLLEKK